MAIHIFLGTKAEYIKTAPLMRLFSEEGVAYRLIDSGQHAEFAGPLRRELGVPDPDVRVIDNGDVSSVRQAVGWGLKLGLKLLSKKRLRATVFGGEGGICVVHGDTPTTLMATLMARRAGLQVAHLEAGLRSHKLTHPFPEEIIRIIVMRLSALLFTPNADAEANLRRMQVKGRIIPIQANTVVEAVRHAGVVAGVGGGGVVATMHRVENLQSKQRIEGFVSLLCNLAESREVLFVMHEPTELTLQKSDALLRLADAGVEVLPLMSYKGFLQRLARVDFAITDGGSIQEECAFMGIPVLLWRDRSERTDGIGENVVVSRYDTAVVDDFIENYESYRRPPVQEELAPSRIAFETLTNWSVGGS